MRIKSSKTWKRHMAGQPVKVSSRNYYSDLATNKKSRLKKIIWLILAVLLVQAFFQVKFLALNNFVLSGNQAMTAEQIKPEVDEALSKSRFVIFKNSNYFMFEERALADKLKEKYNLDSVEISKDFPHIVEIKIQEKVSQFVWQRNGKLSLVNSRGSVNQDISVADEKYLLVVDQRTSEPVLPQVFSETELTNINKIFDSWQAIVGENPKLKQITLSDDADSLRLGTKAGYDVILDLSEDIETQLNNLKRILAGEIITNNIEYIDLRFGDRVFFK